MKMNESDLNSTTLKCLYLMGSLLNHGIRQRSTIYLAADTNIVVEDIMYKKSRHAGYVYLLHLLK